MPNPSSWQTWQRGYSHLVWDWNGTLLNDTWISADITNLMLADRGRPGLSIEDYRRQFGFPLEEYCRQIGFDLEAETIAQISDCFIEKYELRRLECDLHPSSRPLLDSLHEIGIEQMILSAYRQETLDELVLHFGLRKYIGQAVGVDNDRGEGKVGIGLAWLETAEVSPSSVLLIGDTLHDHEVAEAMEVDCILVAHGHQSTARLQSSGREVFADFAALARALELPVRATD